MSSGGGGEGGPHLRRLRDDLQTVVRSSLTPLMESGTSASGASSVPSSLATHLASASTVQTSATTWQDNITVTVQPQLLPPRSQSHVLDIEVFQSQQQQQPGGESNNTQQQQQQQQRLDVRARRWVQGK